MNISQIIEQKKAIARDLNETDTSNMSNNHRDTHWT